MPVARKVLMGMLKVQIMNDAFQGILGQPQVRDFLRTSVRSDRVTHAYLFAGPAGSNKTQAAFALAQAILCPKGPSDAKGGACGACDNCTRALKRTHPDIHYYQPDGANGYLVEQVREIVSDVSLAPIQASKKVYILDRVDLLGRSAANAFLKTLEEPPDDVVLILLGRTRESVLPTISSRCQIVPFRHIPPTEAAGIVTQNTGASIMQAKEAMEACAGSITGAIAFLKAHGNERLFFRSELMKSLSQIESMDDWQICVLARSLVEKSKAPLDVLRAEQEMELSKNQDFLAKSAIRQIEERNKRKLNSETLAYLKQALSIISSWLRDVEVTLSGATELVINEDFKPEIEAAASIADSSRISEALREVASTMSMLDYNVSPETCFDVVLFKVREAFNGAGRSGQPSI